MVTAVTHQALIARICGLRSVLVARALRLGADRMEAQDVAQETLIRAWQALDTFTARHEGGLRGWLNVILLNVYRSRYRARVSEQRTVAALLQQAQVREAGPAVDCGESTIDAQALLRRLDALPALQRSAMLTIMDGASYAQAAQQLNVPEGTLKSRLFRAREALQA